MEGLLHAYCRPTALELAPFGTYFGSPKSLSQIWTRLTGMCSGMAGPTECSDSLSPNCVLWFIESDYARWLQDSVPRVCAKFGKLRPYFDKVSSQSSYESWGGENQESVKIIYLRYDMPRLGISFSSCSINHSKRSLQTSSMEKWGTHWDFQAALLIFPTNELFKYRL